MKSWFGALIDGRKDGVCKNDFVPVPVNSDSDMYIGNFTSLQPDDILVKYCVGKDEIIAFTKDHPPSIVNPTWTSGRDSINIKFQPKYKLPVHVWLVSGDLGAQRDNATRALAMTQQIWHDERQGFGLLNFPNVTIEDNEDQNILDFDCSLANSIRNHRNEQNVINIYYVDRVIGESDGRYLDSNGIHCGATSGRGYWSMIVMGSNTSPDLLAHEFGHAFALGHVGSFPEFHRSNVMHEASQTRKFLTEGQTFRQVVHTESAIHDPHIYRDYLIAQGVNLLQPRTCYPLRGLPNDQNWFLKADGTVDVAAYRQNAAECPLLQTRIWPELFNPYDLYAVGTPDFNP
jgi:hypothetical protein